MKKNLLLILSVLLAFSVAAQQTVVEKLQAQIRKHPQQDNIRVNLLNELAYLDALTAEQTEALANEALAISRKTGYAEGEGYALLNLGTVNYAVGKHDISIQYLQQADSVAKEIANQELLIYILIQRARGKIITGAARAGLTDLVKAEAMAKETGNIKLLSVSQRVIATVYSNSLSNFSKGTEYSLKAISNAEKTDCLDCLVRCFSTLGALYNIMGDQPNSLIYYQKAIETNKKVGNMKLEATLHNNIGERYRLMGKYTEAIDSYKKSIAGENTPYNVELNQSNIADVYVRMDSLDLAFQYGFTSLATAQQINDKEGIEWIDAILSRAYLGKKMPDSAIYHSRRGLQAAEETGTIEFMRDNAGALADAYVFKKDFENAYKYHALYISYRDSMVNTVVTNKTTVLQYNYDLEKKQAEIAALNQEKKLQKNFLISALTILFFIVLTLIVLIRNNHQKQQANKLLSRQKQIIEEQRDRTNTALAELQQTQNQLIQSEKMASLGELTAGIAHEIQNPLNFINNFSEVNNELIDELVAEVDKENTKEVRKIANDIKENEQKIIHHGKRADSIVKGMLQHSGQTSGIKEPTDINALCNEYLRLSYHGLRAKDKSFNADFKTDLDETIGKLNIVPQDIARVLLNLFNNAFYAVSERHKAEGKVYKPVVSVCTKRIGSPLGEGGVRIIVTDNGAGIPQNIIDKIFQPFFTTKPTGQGTGLGLSLAYDIIIKEHNGTIKVESPPAGRTGKEGSVFIVELPNA